MRELDLVRAEFNDCVQDLAQTYEDSAKLKLGIADLVRGITADSLLSATGSMPITKALLDNMSAADSNYLRLQELTARYSRLTVELLRGSAPK